MRAAAAALLAARSLAAAAAPASARSQPRALIAFLPPARRPCRPLLEELAARGLAVGMTSARRSAATRREQMAIDIGQGARISTRAYKSKCRRWRSPATGSPAGRPSCTAPTRRPATSCRGCSPPPSSAPEGAWPTPGWTAPTAPQAIAAADSRGRIGAVSLGPAATAAGRALALWQPGSLVVARLPGAARSTGCWRPAGRSTSSTSCRRRRAKGLELLPSGAAAPGYRGALRSAHDPHAPASSPPPTSRRPCWRGSGWPVPKKMQGERIESRGGHGAAYVRDLGERLDAILPHRSAALRTVVLGLDRAARGDGAAAAAGEGCALRRPGRLPQRALAAGADLLAAALQPSSTAEAVLLARRVARRSGR